MFKADLGQGENALAKPFVTVPLGSDGGPLFGDEQAHVTRLVNPSQLDLAELDGGGAGAAQLKNLSVLQPADWLV